MVSIFDRMYREQKMVNDTENLIKNNIEHNVSHLDNRYIGRIIKLNKRGYGFISCPEIPFTKIFFHWTALRQNTKKFNELEVGNKVEFSKEEVVDKGTRALRINILE
jgi:cold shock CspA family protein